MHGHNGAGWLCPVQNVIEHMFEKMIEAITNSCISKNMSENNFRCRLAVPFVLLGLVCLMFNQFDRFCERFWRWGGLGVGAHWMAILGP